MLNEVIRAVIRLAIDYFRWTQLIPMLACWGLLLAVLLAMTLTSFETQGIAALEVVFAIIFGIGSYLPDAMLPRGPDGSIELSGGELLDLATWLWLLISVVAMFVNWLIGERLRPRFLSTLAGRIKVAAVAAALVSASLILVRLLVPENFNGPFISWLPTFVGMPLIVWIVSVYSLCVSAILKLLDESVVSRI